MNHEEREQFAEHLLDSALQQYSAVEPRPGLETRILANLASTRRRRFPFSLPRLAWVVMAAAVALVMVGISIREHQRPAQIAFVPAPPAITAHPPVTPLKPLEATIPVPTRKHMALPRQLSRSEPSPRQEQFPSPEPLSDQERLLLTYLRTTPREEVLVAVTQLQAERAEGIQWFNNDTE